MKKKTTLSVVLLLAFLLTMIGGCFTPNDETSSAKNTENKEDSKVSTSSQTDNDINDSDGTEQEDESSNTDDNSAAEKTQEGNQNTTTIETANDSKDFDLDQYLNTNYIIDGVHYKTKSFGEIEGTDRIDYRVDILPDNKNAGDEINSIFKNGTPNDNKRTAAMMNIAGNIVNDLPVINKKVHIDSVNWVSYDGEFEVKLIQDFQKSTIEDSDE
ncbi:hypothetical protein VBD025_15540 [Virgibacillus flavescens]|uniref:hypothetical protein n=1 Tax=Virgibacillus flavescens TaxID=1611422 RepID=UPI003D32A8DF